MSPLYLALVLGIFPTLLFDSEPRVRGSSQGLPSLINEVMEHVERGNKVGIYDPPILCYDIRWKFPISLVSYFVQWWLLIIGIQGTCGC